MATKRTCRRCGGSKVYPVPGDRLDTCWGCGGEGFIVVRSKAEQMQMATAYARESAARNAVKERAKTLTPPAGMASVVFSDEVRRGFNLLRDNEPERLVKLFTSLDDGRIDDVVYALYDYRTAQR